MFREQRRTKRILSEQAARELLVTEKRAVLAVNGDDGYPYAIPIDYFYDDANDKIYFHGSRIGHKIDSIKRDDKVCFTVYGNERMEDGDWAPYLDSVVVFGRCHLLNEAQETTAYLRKLAERYFPSEEEINRMIAAEPAVQVFEISIEHISGKKIHEK